MAFGFANVAGELVCGLFTRDFVLLGMSVHLDLLSLLWWARCVCVLATCWLDTANGLDDTSPTDLSQIP